MVASNAFNNPGTEEQYTTAENDSSKSVAEEIEKDFIIEESQSQTSSSSTVANSALLEKIHAIEKEIFVEQ